MCQALTAIIINIITLVSIRSTNSKQQKQIYLIFHYFLAMSERLFSKKRDPCADSLAIIYRCKIYVIEKQFLMPNLLNLQFVSTKLNYSCDNLYMSKVCSLRLIHK